MMGMVFGSAGTPFWPWQALHTSAFASMGSWASAGRLATAIKAPAAIIVVSLLSMFSPLEGLWSWILPIIRTCGAVRNSLSAALSVAVNRSDMWKWGRLPKWSQSIEAAVSALAAARRRGVAHGFAHDLWQVAHQTVDGRLQSVDLALDAIKPGLDCCKVVAVSPGLLKNMAGNHLLAVDLAFENIDACLKMLEFAPCDVGSHSSYPHLCDYLNMGGALPRSRNISNAAEPARGTGSGATNGSVTCRANVASSGLSATAAAISIDLAHRIRHDAWQVFGQVLDFPLQTVDFALKARGINPIKFGLDTVQARLDGGKVVAIAAGLFEDLAFDCLVAVAFVFENVNASFELLEFFPGDVGRHSSCLRHYDNLSMGGAWQRVELTACPGRSVA